MGSLSTWITDEPRPQRIATSSDTDILARQPAEVFAGRRNWPVTLGEGKTDPRRPAIDAIYLWAKRNCQKHQKPCWASPMFDVLLQIPDAVFLGSKMCMATSAPNFQETGKSQIWRERCLGAIWTPVFMVTPQKEWYAIVSRILFVYLMLSFLGLL